MKKIAFVVVCICMCMSTFAQQSVQNIRYEGAITKAISQEKFQGYQSTVPFKLVEVYSDLMAFCYIDNQLPANCIVWGDYSEYLLEGKTLDDATQLVQSKQICYRNYRFQRDENHPYAYKIGETGFYIIVRSTIAYDQEKKRIAASFGL